MPALLRAEAEDAGVKVPAPAAPGGADTKTIEPRPVISVILRASSLKKSPKTTVRNSSENEDVQAFDFGSQIRPIKIN